MTILIIMFISLIVGLVLSWGPNVWQFFLNSFGAFERLSWFSLIGTAMLAIFWCIFAVLMYSHANAKIELVDDESLEVPKSGKKMLIIGILVTLCWIALFIFTDNAATAAKNFAAWQLEKASMLKTAQKIGHLLLAFCAGIVASLFCRTRPRKRRKSDVQATETEDDSSGEQQTSN